MYYFQERRLAKTVWSSLSGSLTFVSEDNI